MLRRFCRGEFCGGGREGNTSSADADFDDSAHTQAIAYVIAETASEKMVGEYIQG